MLIFDVLRTAVVKGPPAAAVLRLERPAANSELFTSGAPATPGAWYVAQGPLTAGELAWAVNVGEQQIMIPLFPYNVASNAGIFAGVQCMHDLFLKLPPGVEVDRVVVALGLDERGETEKYQWMGLAVWTNRS